MNPFLASSPFDVEPSNPFVDAHASSTSSSSSSSSSSKPLPPRPSKLQHTPTTIERSPSNDSSNPFLDDSGTSSNASHSLTSSSSSSSSYVPPLPPKPTLSTSSSYSTPATPPPPPYRPPTPPPPYQPIAPTPSPAPAPSPPQHQFDHERQQLLSQIVSLQQEKESLYLKLESALKSSAQSVSITPSPPVQSLPIDIPTIIERIAIGQPYSIHHIKSYQEKSSLLDQALQSGNSSVSLTAILFLKQSLSVDLFNKLLVKYPSSIAIYASHLKRISDYHSLLGLYRGLGRHNDELLTLFELSNRSTDLVEKRHHLDAAVSLCKRIDSLAFYADQCRDQMALLSRQIQIEQHDSKMAAQGDAVYAKFPRINIIGLSVAHTLEYCSFYHPTTPADKLSSPQGMRQAFNVSEKLFVMCKLRSRSRIGDWEAVKELGLSKKKGIFSSTPVTPIGFESFVTYIDKYHGPAEMLVQFAQLIDPLERRFRVSLDYRLFDLALETLVSMKDRSKAADFRNAIYNTLGAEASTELRTRLDAALSNSKIKWKN